MLWIVAFNKRISLSFQIVMFLQLTRSQWIAEAHSNKGIRNALPVVSKVMERTKPIPFNLTLHFRTMSRHVAHENRDFLNIGHSHETMGNLNHSLEGHVTHLLQGKMPFRGEYCQYVTISWGLLTDASHSKTYWKKRVSVTRNLPI
jgi:hypothetical protein